MKIVSLTLCGIWALGGLIAVTVGLTTEGGMLFLALGSAVAALSVLTGVLLHVNNPVAAEGCLLGAGVLSLPAGIAPTPCHRARCGRSARARWTSTRGCTGWR